MHETLFASINLNHALSFIAWKNSFDSNALVTIDPVGLDECTLPDNLAAFEEVSVSICGETRGLNFRRAFYVCWNQNADLENF
jgi:hypothetical protein